MISVKRTEWSTHWKIFCPMNGSLPMKKIVQLGGEAAFSCGEAIKYLKRGYRVARKGWNGKGIYLEMQVPDKHSKMTLPYIYIVTSGLVTDNPDAPKGVVPWAPSQTDMLANDWIFAGDDECEQEEKA